MASPLPQEHAAGAAAAASSASPASPASPDPAAAAAAASGSSGAQKRKADGSSKGQPPKKKAATAASGAEKKTQVRWTKAEVSLFDEICVEKPALISQWTKMLAEWQRRSVGRADIRQMSARQLQDKHGTRKKTLKNRAKRAATTAAAGAVQAAAAASEPMDEREDA